MEPLVHIALLLAALLACGGKSKSDSVGSSTGDTAADEKATPVKASDLLADYTGNEIRGDAKWKGKLVDAVGFVGDIKKDFTDSAYIVLNTAPGAIEFNTVHCRLQSGQEGAAGALSKGEAIILTGRVSGLMVGSVILKDCKVGKRGKDMVAPAPPVATAAPAAHPPPAPRKR